MVGPSVLIGAMIGTLIGAVINGWSPKPRLIAYLIASVTIVPFGIFLLSEPQALYVFGMFRSARDSVDPSALTAFSSATAVITLALVAVAYRYDDKCRSTWSAHVDTEFPIHSFCRKLHTQIVSLAPWTVLAAIASAALVFLRSGSSSVQTAAITWSFEQAYLFEHIGMFGPFVPMVFGSNRFCVFGSVVGCASPSVQVQKHVESQSSHGAKRQRFSGRTFARRSSSARRGLQSHGTCGA